MLFHSSVTLYYNSVYTYLISLTKVVILLISKTCKTSKYNLSPSKMLVDWPSLWGRGVDYHTLACQWRVEMTSGVFGSQAWLACSYFAKVQPCGSDFTHRNRAQVNTYHLLLSSFFLFNVWVKVNSLTFAIGNFCPYSSKFVSQHVAAAVWLKQQSTSSQKAVWRKMESKSGIWKRENKQKMARLLEVSSQWWIAFVAH